MNEEPSVFALAPLLGRLLLALLFTPIRWPRAPAVPRAFETTL